MRDAKTDARASVDRVQSISAELCRNVNGIRVPDVVVGKRDANTQRDL